MSQGATSLFSAVGQSALTLATLEGFYGLEAQKTTCRFGWTPCSRISVHDVCQIPKTAQHCFQMLPSISTATKHLGMAHRYFFKHTLNIYQHLEWLNPPKIIQTHGAFDHLKRPWDMAPMASRTAVTRNVWPKMGKTSHDDKVMIQITKGQVCPDANS